MLRREGDRAVVVQCTGGEIVAPFSHLSSQPSPAKGGRSLSALASDRLKKRTGNLLRAVSSSWHYLRIASVNHKRALQL